MSPLGTPVPLPEKPQSTATAIPSATPTVPPPPGWPTDVPWPPPPQTPQPTAIPQPFPTPVFPPLRGQRPATLQTIWFPYYPAPGSAPQMQAILVDRQAQRWVQSDHTLALDLPAPNQYALDTGPILIDLYPSPNSQWLVADFAYGGSRLVDLSSGEAIQFPAIDSPAAEWRFLAWHPDGQYILIAAGEELLLSDLASQEYEMLNYYSCPAFEHAQVNAIAYSPSGQMADAVVYPPVYQSREGWSVEIGLRKDKDESRESITQIPGGVYLASHSLRWSPNGDKLIWIVKVVPSESSVPIRIEDTQSQLWVAEMHSGDVRVLTTLGQASGYNHPAVWSPDGRYIAALKIEGVQGSKDTASNIHVFDPESGTERQVTHFVDWRLSHLTWSPDGQWLAFTVSKGKYGEIWVTNLEGTQQYPIAGPTLPNAPFVWLPARGEKQQ